MNEKKENVIVNGFFWRFAERCGVQLISAVVSILLARILTPDDYGKVALVTVFNNIMYVLLDCGIGTALVQKKEVDELDYSSAFFFSSSWYRSISYQCSSIAGSRCGRLARIGKPDLFMFSVFLYSITVFLRKSLFPSKNAKPP